MIERHDEAPGPRSRRVLLVCLGLLVCWIGADVAGAGGVSSMGRDSVAVGPETEGQDESPTTTLAPIARNQIPVNDIIPKPNSGVAPQRRGDRGGWGQILVVGLMIGGVAAIAVRIMGEARRATRRTTPGSGE